LQLYQLKESKMLTPASDDPNKSAEDKRQKEDPSSFGAAVPLPDSLRDLTGNGLNSKITIETIESNKKHKTL